MGLCGRRDRSYPVCRRIWRNIQKSRTLQSKTKADFKKFCNFVRELSFDKCHVESGQDHIAKVCRKRSSLSILCPVFDGKDNCHDQRAIERDFDRISDKRREENIKADVPKSNGAYAGSGIYILGRMQCGDSDLCQDHVSEPVRYGRHVAESDCEYGTDILFLVRYPGCNHADHQPGKEDFICADRIQYIVCSAVRYYDSILGVERICICSAHSEYNLFCTGLPVRGI